MEQVEQELQKLIALEAQIDQLTSLRRRVEKEGMSKGVALEARELVPGFDNNRPLAFYSEHPSYAHQVVALEAMGASLISLIVMAIAALSAMIAGLIKFFKGKKNGGAGGSSFTVEWEYKGRTYHSYSDASKAREDDLRKYREEMERQARDRERDERFERSEAHFDAAMDRLHGTEALPELDVLFDRAVQEQGPDSRIARMLHAEEPFMYDIITNGPYSVSLHSALSIAEHLGKDLVGISGNISTLTRDFPYIMENPNLDYGGAKEIFSRIMNMGEVVTGGFVRKLESIQSAREEMHTSPPLKFKYSELVRRTRDAIERAPVKQMLAIHENCIAELPEIEAKLTKLAQGMGKYEKQADLTHVQKDYQSRAADMVKVIRKEITDIARYLTELDRYARTLRATENRMFKLEIEGVKLIAEHAKKNGGLTPEMKKLEKKMLEDMTIDV